MNIILKQKEIEAALKLYALQQGIQLAGKIVLISFTAGRKDTGISAELDITDKVDTVSFIDTLIEQQANAIVIPEIPEAPAPVILPVVDRLKTSAEIAEAAKEIGVTPVAEAFPEPAEAIPEELDGTFIDEGTKVEQEPAPIVQAPVVNIFGNPFAAPTPAPQPKVELVEEDEALFDVDEPHEEVVVAQPVKSVSLFG